MVVFAGRGDRPRRGAVDHRMLVVGSGEGPGGGLELEAFAGAGRGVDRRAGVGV